MRDDTFSIFRTQQELKQSLTQSTFLLSSCWHRNKEKKRRTQIESRFIEIEFYVLCPEDLFHAAQSCRRMTRAVVVNRANLRSEIVVGNIDIVIVENFSRERPISISEGTDRRASLLAGKRTKDRSARKESVKCPLMNLQVSNILHYNDATHSLYYLLTPRA